jgi:hypothetical protein
LNDLHFHVLITVKAFFSLNDHLFCSSSNLIYPSNSINLGQDKLIHHFYRFVTMEIEDRKKTKLALGGSLLILVLLVSGREDRFQKVINEQNDSEVVKQLERFRRGGIEHAVDKENYDPEKVIDEALSYQGTPHCMAGTSSKGIDCSGLVMVAHESCGIELPHSAEEQARFGTIVPTMKELKRGDLVFFYNTYSTPKLITHSGIYLGKGEFIHASSAKGVVVSDLESDYYLKHFIFATRLD